MRIYLFRDEGDSEVFALATEPDGSKHSACHAAYRVDFPSKLSSFQSRGTSPIAKRCSII